MKWQNQEQRERSSLTKVNQRKISKTLTENLNETASSIDKTLTLNTVLLKDLKHQNNQ